MTKARNIYKTYLCKSSELWTVDPTTTNFIFLKKLETKFL